MQRGWLLLLAVGCSSSDLDSTSQGASCTATDLFAETVCVCDELRDVGNLVVGTSVAGDHATLAVLGPSKVINNFQVRGDFVPYGGLTATGNLEVTGSLATAGALDDLGNLNVSGDLDVGGDLSGIGRLAVGGTLRVGGADRFVGFEEVAATGPYTAIPPPACGCTDVFDVAGAVAAARTANDNAARGLPTSIRAIGATSLVIPTGRYYFSDLEAIGATGLVIDGHVSLYLDGNLEHVGAAWIRLENGAMLDLYVSGSVRTIGHVELGNKWDPSAFRLYVGGAEPATLQVGNQIFNGAIYAPRSELTYVGNTQLRGAVTARAIHGIGNLEIGYAAPQCPEEDPEPDPPPPPSSDDPPVLL